MRLYAVNAAAARCAITPGMMLTDARARLPALAHAPADIEGDGDALARMGEWCLRYSPWVAVDGADGFLIDVSGCAHLFGGEAALLTRMESEIGALGLSVRLGLAGTAGAAWALARFGPARAIAPAGETETSLAPLPVAGLRLAAHVRLLLQRLGIKRVGQLYDMPRAALARRFRSPEAEQAVLLRLDQALGRQPEPLSPLHPAPRFRAHGRFADPVQETGFLPEVLRQSAADLKASLVREGQGGTWWTFRALRLDGAVSSVFLRTGRPVRDPDHLTRLFGERLDGVDLGPGAEHFILSADETAPFVQGQGAFDAGAGETLSQEDKLSCLIDRLCARLGPRAVRRHVPRASHVPERAAAGIGAQRGAGESWSVSRAGGPSRPVRPVRVLARPEPIEVIAEVPDGPPMRFRWRRVLHQVARAAGPERIAPEWWRLREGVFEETRDYYRIEDVAGRRYWVFRAGLYQGPADPAQAPCWFLHGFFG